MPNKDTVIIVGAGPAGLAVGTCLRRVGVAITLLDQGDKTGMAWRRHYERLHLHTAKAFSALPCLSFPAHYPRYPSREQVVEYLDGYARHFDLQPEFGQQVRAARRDADEWEIETQSRVYRGRRLVIATGYNREPNRPTWPGEPLFRGPVLHSAQYCNGQVFKGRRVLVVGFGNSGGEIAIDLWEHGARAALAVRGPVNVVPRELCGIPILAIAIALRRLPPRLADAINAPILRLALGDLAPYGLRQLTQGPLTQIRREAHIPLIDVGTIDLIKRGHVAVHPGLERFTEDGVVFTDGTQAPFEAVILATGYRPRANAFLADATGVCNPDGVPLTSGREAAFTGLYFCGFNVAATGMFREIGLEAKHIAAGIAGKRRYSRQ